MAFNSPGRFNVTSAMSSSSVCNSTAAIPAPYPEPCSYGAGAVR
ncbi:hypothetical protein I546_3177 [Mycobacterium kansasii 732]|nr:hypothetical protein I546_3177 [Mycobacterium kansasii 732]